MRFKKLKWKIIEENKEIMGFIELFNCRTIDFTIMLFDNIIKVIDIQDNKTYEVKSFEDGKVFAQYLFDGYCNEIIKNIIERN